MESFHRTPFGAQRGLGERQIPDCSRHSFVRTGDHGREQPRNPGRKLSLHGSGDILVRRLGRTVVDAGEAVDLYVDETGRHVLRGGHFTDQRLYVRQHPVKANLDSLARSVIQPNTIIVIHVLCTAFTQSMARNRFNPLVK